MRGLTNKLRRLANTIVAKPMRGTAGPTRTELDAKADLQALAGKIEVEERRLKDLDLTEANRQGTFWE